MSNRRQYILNLVWSWTGAIALIVNGVLVSRFIIRKLGSEQYGIWALGLSLVEYFWMIDLGLRPATVKLSAEYRALGKWAALNEIFSTGVAYSAVVGTFIFLLLSLNTGWIANFFHISHPSFPLLIHAISLSWAFGLVFNVFAAGLEGFQRFDIMNRIYVIFLAVRSAIQIVLVLTGFGIAGMSVSLLVIQLSMYLSFFISLQRIYPELRVSPALITKEAGREIWRFARQMILASISGRITQSAVPSLIVRLMPVRNLTYYSVSQKVLEYVAEGIGRVGLITAPRAMDLIARGMRPQVIALAEYGNKYCLAAWLVISTYMIVYGRPLFRIWISQEFADHAYILVPIFLFGQTLWLGQFICSSILMGIGRYSEYSASLLIEAIITVIGFGLALPHFGLAGGVAVSSAMIFLNRCVNLCRIFCKEFDIAPLPFVWRIYRMPMFLGLLDLAFQWVLRETILPGRNWGELVLAGVLQASLYGVAAFFLVLEPPHRELLVEMLHTRSKRALAVFAG